MARRRARMVAGQVNKHRSPDPRNIYFFFFFLACRNTPNGKREGRGRDPHEKTREQRVATEKKGKLATGLSSHTRYTRATRVKESSARRGKGRVRGRQRRENRERETKVTTPGTTAARTRTARGRKNRWNDRSLLFRFFLWCRWRGRRRPTPPTPTPPTVH